MSADSTSARPESVIGEPETVVAAPETVIAEAETVMAAPEPVIAETPAATAETQSVIAEPVIGDTAFLPASASAGATPLSPATSAVGGTKRRSPFARRGAASAAPSPAGPVPTGRSKPAARSKPTGGRRRRIVVALSVTLGVVVLAAAGAVFGIARYYADRVHPGVTLAGRDLAGMSADEVGATVRQLVDGKQMTLTLTSSQGQQTLTAKPADLGLAVDVAATTQAALDADQRVSLLAGYAPWRAKPVDFVTTSQPAVADAWVQAQLASSTRPSVDATVRFDEASATFVTTPAASGAAIDTTELDRAIDGWAKDPTSSPRVDLAVAESAPAIPDAAAQAAAAEANSRLALSVEVTTAVGSYSPSQAARVRWTKLTPNPAKGAIDLSYDRDAMNADLPDALTEALTQPRKDKKILTAPSGATLGSLQEGQDGVVLASQTAVIDQIASALDHGTPLKAQAETTTDKSQTTTQSITAMAGGKWIDVNLSNYHVTPYEGASAVNSFLVSYGAPGHETPIGLFTILRRYTVDRMVGQIVPSTGKPEYDTMVNWVSYFTDGGVAFHSAPWAAPYGGNVSHGCVNMSPGDAQWMYYWTAIGIPVYVHY